MLLAPVDGHPQFWVIDFEWDIYIVQSGLENYIERVLKWLGVAQAIRKDNLRLNGLVGNGCDFDLVVEFGYIFSDFGLLDE